MMRVFGWVVVLLLLCSSAALGESPGCTRKQAQLAEAQASHIRSWDSLYRSFLRYHNCDDGDIAEGFDDVVSLKLLLSNWDALPQLAALSEKDKHFKSFVLKHISLTALGADDLKKLKAKAVHRCPSGQATICGDIRRRIVKLEHE